MKISKSYLTKIILEEYQKVIAEATEEEIGHLDDVLQVPLDKLPFHNIFGNRYRLLGSFKSDDPNSPFMKFESFLNRAGWRFNPDDMGEVVKTIKTSYIAKPEDGVQHRTKEEKMSIVKWMQELLSYLDSIPSVMNQWNDIMKEMAEYANTTFKSDKPVPAYRRSGGFKKEYLQDKKYLAMFRRRLSLKKAIMKFLPEENTMQVFAGIGRVRWGRGEETSNDVEDFFKISNLKKEAGEQSQWLMGSKGTGQKPYETFSGQSLSEYKERLGEVEYVVFSRHPIDVFRMSDHEGLNSCHSLPSSKEEQRYDQYNICALAEAHANGMIAYALNPDEFEEPPTQELLDQYEDGELFSDDEREVEGLVPVARLRIRNVAFLQDKGDYSEVVSRIAVPEKRSYGDDIPGFKEYVSKVMASAQRNTIQDIIEKSGDIIDFRRFLRVGGSYQDNSIESTLPDLLKLASDREDLEFEQSVQYSNDLEQSLKEKHAARTIDDVREVLQSLKEEYNGGYVNFENLDVEEDWNGNGFFMSGEVRIIYEYGNEITRVEGNQDVQGIMEEAVEYVSELYFYDDRWFRDTSTLFESFWGGYKNVMIISFNISNFSPEDNDEYIPYDPDTWMYAMSEIKDKCSSMMDPHMDDSINNYIKHYISYNGSSVVTTDVSGEYVMKDFKNGIENDENWDVEDEEVDDDNMMGLEVITSFVASHSGGASLDEVFEKLSGDYFDEDNPEIVEKGKRMSGALATTISMLTSEGMNALKASLLYSKIADNPQLYGTFSQASKLNELNMSITPSIGWDEEISPERILKGIEDGEDLELEIRITCENWTASDIAVIGGMMLGDLTDSAGWHIEPDECLEKLIGADLSRLGNN